MYSSSSSTEQLKDSAARLALRAKTKDEEFIIGGSVIDGELRMLRFNDYHLDLPIQGNLLIMEYPDRPGMVGKYGSILGEASVNIARMEVSRVDGRGDALVVLTLDDPVPAAVIESIKAEVNPLKIHAISF